MDSVTVRVLPLCECQCQEQSQHHSLCLQEDESWQPRLFSRKRPLLLWPMLLSLQLRGLSLPVPDVHFRLSEQQDGGVQWPWSMLL